MSFRSSAFSFPPAPVSRLSRCFSTTADGRIPLTTDWARLLGALETLPRLAWQTRHHYARLIAMDRLPPASPQHPLGPRVNATGHVEFDLARWHVAWARVALCPCCQSAGRIELRNVHGAEFMHLCAHPAMEPATWAETLAALTEGRPDDLTAIAFDGAPRYTLPTVPSRATSLGDEVEKLTDLLHALSAHDRTVCTVLRTAEVGHRRRFHPTQVTQRGSLLQIWSRHTTLQLALHAAAELVLEPHTDGAWLHAVGADETVLMSFGPGASTGTDRHGWDDALQRVFLG